MKKPTEIKIRISKKSKEAILRQATLLAAHHFLVPGEGTVKEQYERLKKIGSKNNSEMASDYSDPVQFCEYETVGGLIANIEEMANDNVKFAHNVLKMVGSEMQVFTPAP